MMHATATPSAQSSALRVAIGFSHDPDPGRAVLDAAEAARAGLGGGTPQLGLVVTAGETTHDPIPPVRSVLGPIGLAGGASSAILADRGIFARGVLVVAFATEGDATTGAACVTAPDLADAGRRAARIVMAGWPFRLRYPRGLGIAFASGSSPIPFLEAWRQFMGPKMRTLCGMMPRHTVYGAGTQSPLASVACLEASYATGLGYAEGFAPEARPEPATLVHGAVEATRTALKRLDERSARLVLVLETSARHDTLGDAADGAWSSVLSEVSGHAPCVGWLCDRVAGYGRGIQPADEHGSLMVAAIGDPPVVTG